MGKPNKFGKRKASSYNRKSKNLETRTSERKRFIVLSLKNFDRNQGQSFEDWEESGLLAKAMQTLRAVCELTVLEATTKQIVKCYSKVDFPQNSNFKHPKHIPPDVTWCSMHIQGKECVIGYFEGNIFHVVFLDKKHEFWITEKKNT